MGDMPERLMITWSSAYDCWMASCIGPRQEYVRADLAAEQIERLEHEIKVLRSQVGILKKHLANFDHFYPDGYQEKG